MLDLVQHHLETNGFVFQRIDGQSSIPQRHQAIRRFNEDPTCVVMLASIGSAGEGSVLFSEIHWRQTNSYVHFISIDLTVADNVHLLEPHWNPMVEAQAIDRVHRLGQTREVLTTRYVTRNTIEDVSQRTPTSALRTLRNRSDFLTHDSQSQNSMFAGFKRTSFESSIKRSILRLQILRMPKSRKLGGRYVPCSYCSGTDNEQYPQELQKYINSRSRADSSISNG